MFGRMAEFIACVGIKNVASVRKKGLVVALSMVEQEEEEEDDPDLIWIARVVVGAVQILLAPYFMWFQ